MIGRRFRGVMLFRRDDPLDPLHRFLHFAIQGVIQYGGPFLRIFLPDAVRVRVGQFQIAIHFPVVFMNFHSRLFSNADHGPVRGKAMDKQGIDMLVPAMNGRTVK